MTNYVDWGFVLPGRMTKQIFNKRCSHDPDDRRGNGAARFSRRGDHWSPAKHRFTASSRRATSMPPLRSSAAFVGAGFIPPSCSSLNYDCHPEQSEGSCETDINPPRRILRRFTPQDDRRGNGAARFSHRGDHWSPESIGLQRATGGRHQCRPYDHRQPSLGRDSSRPRVPH